MASGHRRTREATRPVDEGGPGERAGLEPAGKAKGYFFPQFAMIITGNILPFLMMFTAPTCTPFISSA